VPVLDISQDDLEDRTRLGIATAYVAAVMLSPRDPDVRDRLFRSGQVKQGEMRLSLREFGRLPPCEKAESDYRRLLDMARSLPSVESIRNEMRTLRLRGLIAGYVLYELLSARKDGTNKTTKSKGHVLGALTNINTKFGKFLFREHTQIDFINKEVWPTYRPVAHLYAAATQVELNGVAFFPCQPQILPQFLALAEHYREGGENLQMLRKPPGHSVLDSSETWSVPRSINLPEVIPT
jgi:hypothetical protein